MFVIITGLFEVIYNNLIELPTLMRKVIHSSGEGQICRLDYGGQLKINVEECEELSSDTTQFGIKIMSASIYEEIRTLETISSNYYICEANI